jgi:hypothetical protein
MRVHSSIVSNKKLGVNAVMNASVLIIGKSKSGKSSLITKIVDGNYDDGILFTTHKHGNLNKLDIFKESTKYELDSDYIQEYLEKINIEDKKKHLVVIDSIVYKNIWMKDPVIIDLFMNAKSYGVSLIMTMQYPMKINLIRNCFNYTCLFNETSVSCLQKLYKLYAPMIPNYSLFKTTFENLTQDFDCMIISNKNKPKNWKKRIFCYNINDKSDEELELESQLELELEERIQENLVVETIKPSENKEQIIVAGKPIEIKEEIKQDIKEEIKLVEMKDEIIQVKEEPKIDETGYVSQIFTYIGSWMPTIY